ncbi:MAG: hypothetical protein AB8B66_01595 [Rickettsiaceae bacterium]
MTQKQIVQILAGATKIAKQSQQMITDSSKKFIEEELLQGNYVTREEYNQLKTLVLRLEQKLSTLDSAQNKK